jgi:hypothetical protein
VDSFIFDWYWYDDGPFLQRGLEEGFLGAANNHRLKFALMWANHDWLDLHPLKRSPKPFEDATVLYPGAVSPMTFDRIADHCIERYFRRENYWKLDGCPYFSFYELSKLMEGFGSLEASREMLDRFRAKAKRAGFPDLHLNAVVWNNPILPGESAPADSRRVVESLGFDSVTSYVWIHHYATDRFPEVEYETIKRAYMDHWGETAEKFEVPYYPNVTMGWDSSPRTVQSDRFERLGYPFMYTIGENSPEAFAGALRETMDALADRDLPHPFLTINAWNEWTEGSYLEPDTENGMAYLEAIRDATTASNAAAAR